MARFGTFVLLAAALAVPLLHVRGGVYSPDAPSPFPVRADGTAEELPFGPEFEGPFAQQFGRRLNEADDRPEAVRGSKNEDRTGLLARIDGLKGKGGEAAALSAAYLRAGNATEALNLLAPLSRSRSPDFRVLAHFAHAPRGPRRVGGGSPLAPGGRPRRRIPGRPARPPHPSSVSGC